MLWQTHDGFDSEIKKIAKKYPQLNDGIKLSKRLLEIQFHPYDPRAIIGPSKIHRITADQTWEIWKLEVALPKSGLKPNQWPRIWFAVSGDVITLLTIDVHMNNYDDNTKDRLAIERYSDIS